MRTKVSPMNHYNARSNLTQEIQFLEFMGGSNVPQAFPILLAFY